MNLFENHYEYMLILKKKFFEMQLIKIQDPFIKINIVDIIFQVVLYY